MGFLSWLFKEEDPPEPLVFGALLQCPHGSKKNYLFVETDNLDIEHLPQAYVDDCKAYKNIMPFGECLSGSLCEYKMELEKQWENPEPQTMLVNGKEIITTKSVLLCKAEGVEIKAIKSGQDRVFAEQVLLYAEMDAKYPGLSEILDDPYGSLYLKEGMYEKAIQFLEDRLKHNGGELFLPTIYDKDNPEGDIIRGILARLLPDCDASAFDRLINGLETAGYQNGMDEDAGYDVHTLNAEMIEMLRRDCKKTAEKIETDENARWMEEHKKFMTIFADSVTEFAYGVAIYHSATAKERSQGRDEVEETGEESNGEAEKKLEQENGETTEIGGENSKKTVDVNGKTVTIDDSTFDPNFVDKQGRTNIQRMEQGLAPIGTDGKSVNIHHIDQTNNGPVMEITATEHQQNYSNLHTNTGQTPSQINRTEFNSWRRNYWEWRSNNLG